MAKELPYFKFEPNEWENGNIQLCSREDKGLYVDICSIYWSRLGDLSLKLVVKKLCGGNASALDSLIEEEIIKVDDGKIHILFLDDQLNEFGRIREQNRKAARKRWGKSADNEGDNAGALPPHSESHTERNANRGEEKREEESKEDDSSLEKNQSKKFNFKQALLDYGFKKNLVEDWLKVRKTKKATNTETAWKRLKKKFDGMLEDKNEVLEMIVEKSWSGFEPKWYYNEIAAQEGKDEEDDQNKPSSLR